MRSVRKAALHNLGCKVNAYETESMQQILEQAGYKIVSFEEEADVYVINTCSVTNMADKKSRQMLHRAKRRNPNSVVVAAGCYVQTAIEQVQAEKDIDILIGNNKKHELANLLEKYFREKESFKEQKEKIEQKQKEQKQHWIAIEDIAKEKDYEDLKISHTAGHTRAFIKIQDGCNQFCSYCIIPYARGRVRSRKVSDIMQEVEILASNGYQEVVLTGIHLSSYGIGLEDSVSSKKTEELSKVGSEKKKTDLVIVKENKKMEINLLTLIQKIHKIKGIERIRLGSLEAQIITEQFVQELAKLPKICPHFHLSLQSGCDTTLKRMNRRYTCKEYEEKCKLLRKYFQHPAITTDVIVGFPGETEEEFEITREFLKKIQFFEMHIFKYSLRKGTPAAKMEHQVSEEIKAKRSDILFEDSIPINRKYLKWYIGREVEVLIEESVILNEKEYFIGHTKEYVKCAIPKIENQTCNLQNKLIKGRVLSLLKEHILLMENN